MISGFAPQSRDDLLVVPVPADAGRQSRIVRLIFLQKKL